MAYLAFLSMQKILLIIAIICAFVFISKRYDDALSEAGTFLYNKYKEIDLHNIKLGIVVNSTEDKDCTLGANNHQSEEKSTKTTHLADIKPKQTITSLPAGPVINQIVVPNYAHFIWYTYKPKKLRFHHLLSLLSAQRIMKADKIYFHHNMEPAGRYWEEAKRNIPNLVLQNREPPKAMFGVDLKAPYFETSHSNADRIKIVQEYGGVYFDLDVIITNSLDPLRVYPATVGFELPHWVCGGFIMSAANSTFIYMWLDSMLNDYQVDKWAYISGYLPSVIVQRFKEYGIVHVEPKLIHHPNHANLQYIIGTEKYDWSKNYAVHLWHRLWKESKHWPRVFENARVIKTLNTTFGQIARLIYYGNTELILN